MSVWNCGVSNSNTSSNGSITWWLWNSLKLLVSAIARPTVILPTAGGPKTKSSVMQPAWQPPRRCDSELGLLGLVLGDLPAYVVHVEAADGGDQLLQRRCGQRTGLAEDEDPVAEGHQRRDGADLERAGQRLLGLGVDAGEGDVVVRLRRLLVDGGEHPARAAPG